MPKSRLPDGQLEFHRVSRAVNSTKKAAIKAARSRQAPLPRQRFRQFAPIPRVLRASMSSAALRAPRLNVSSKTVAKLTNAAKRFPEGGDKRAPRPPLQLWHGGTLSLRVVSLALASSVTIRVDDGASGLDLIPS